MTPYFEQAGIRVYHANALDLLSSLDLSTVTAVVTDPPYGETSLDWDRWPPGWPGVLAAALGGRAVSLWCFGSMRMLLEHHAEFVDWSFAQDIVWEKHNGSGFHADRFKRVHEFATHWYRGAWADVVKVPQFTKDATARQVRRKGRPAHLGQIESSVYESEDGGPRLQRSVMRVRSCHGSAVNPTQKPIGIVEPLIRYSSAGGGLVLDPFCGSGTTLVVAKSLGLRAIGIDVRESECESTARRLSQELALGGAA